MYFSSFVIYYDKELYLHKSAHFFVCLPQFLLNRKINQIYVGAQMFAIKFYCNITRKEDSHTQRKSVTQKTPHFPLAVAPADDEAMIKCGRVVCKREKR